MKLPKLSLRDLFWLVLVCAMGLGWGLTAFTLRSFRNSRVEIYMEGYMDGCAHFAVGGQKKSIQRLIPKSAQHSTHIGRNNLTADESTYPRIFGLSARSRVFSEDPARRRLLADDYSRAICETVFGGNVRNPHSLLDTPPAEWHNAVQQRRR